MAELEIYVGLARTLWYMDLRVAEGITGKAGEGVKGARGGRGVVGEFQTWQHLTSIHDGPYVQFRMRKEVIPELLDV